MHWFDLTIKDIEILPQKTQNTQSKPRHVRIKLNVLAWLIAELGGLKKNLMRSTVCLTVTYRLC